jgi:hypothetical protein
MKCLTKDEVSQWLNRTGQIEDPHQNPHEAISLLHAQFYAPKDYPVIEAFTSAFLENVVSEGDLLFQTTDFDLFRDGHKFTFEAFWNYAGESRPIYEAPGCKLPFEERERAVALFSFSVGFRWRSYLYGSHDCIALFNWEGDIFDVWTSSPEKMERTKMMVQGFEFAWVTET